MLDERTLTAKKLYTNKLNFPSSVGLSKLNL